MVKELHPLTEHILYGDIHEMPFDIFGEETATKLLNNPDAEDLEAQTRIAVAANVQAWTEGRLAAGGQLRCTASTLNAFPRTVRERMLLTKAAIFDKMLLLFPGLVNGVDNVNGADLVDFLSEELAQSDEEQFQ